MPEYTVGDKIEVDDGQLRGIFEIEDIDDEDPQGLDDGRYRFCYWVSAFGGDYPIYGPEIVRKVED